MNTLKLLSVAILSLFSGDVDLDTLQAPEGFKISLYAGGVENARQMALGDNGTLFVGSRGEGRVYALVDVNNDNRIDDKQDKKYIIAEDLNMPSGIAFRNGNLYVAAVNRILRYDDIEAKLAQPPKPVVITDQLPDDDHHGWKYILFGPDGYLYVPVGVPCNICLSKDERHGTILKMDAKTGEYEIFARGVRNSVGFDWHPETKELWFTDNGRDWMGDDLPPDELNRAPKAGLHFGFPYMHGDDIRDPEFGDEAEPEKYTKPALAMGAHVAALGMAFYTGDQFPEKYRNAIFIAQHGSWNRTSKTGYRVLVVFLEGGKVKSAEPFVDGWLNKIQDNAWGRPVDVINMPDGSILISDDYADAIYRVNYSNE